MGRRHDYGNSVDTETHIITLKDTSPNEINLSLRENVITLAKICNTTYYRDSQIPVSNFSVLEPFGWSAAGVRGYAYGSDDGALLVIAYKGTSTTYFKPADVIPTDINDKMAVPPSLATTNLPRTTSCLIVVHLDPTLFIHHR
jgi:putative lipase involved disintegration of autophagic bodies